LKNHWADQSYRRLPQAKYLAGIPPIVHEECCRLVSRQGPVAKLGKPLTSCPFFPYTSHVAYSSFFTPSLRAILFLVVEE